MDDIEVVLAPDFASDTPHEVLGCPDTADPQAIDRAYRDLSRKYHPDRWDPDDPNSPFIFQKISKAYAQAKGGGEVPKTVDDAKRAYQDVFGTYRRLHYNEGGVIGIPYAYDLNERLKETKHNRELMSLSFGRFQIMFFRTWLIKEDLSSSLWLTEVILTWVVIAFCVLTFILENNPDIWETATKNGGQIIDIAGGVALMFAQFILCFWYGFTRYPAGGQSYVDWLRYGEKALSFNNKPVVDQDMQDIRRVCSYYLHQDKAERFHPIIFLICFPVVVIEQIPAFACAALVRGGLWISNTRDNNYRWYALHLSTSVAALLVVVGYYILWVYGNNYCKVGATVGLLVSQNLYSAVLFDKSVIEFLQSFIFGNAFLVTINKGTTHSKMKVDPNPIADGSNHSSPGSNQQSGNQNTDHLQKTTIGSRKRVSYAGVVNLETGSVDEFGNITEDFSCEGVETSLTPTLGVTTPGKTTTSKRATSGFFLSLPNSILKHPSLIDLSTPPTPSTVQDVDSLVETLTDHGNNASMDFDIEVFNEKDMESSLERQTTVSHDKDNSNPADVSLNAEEILHDLDHKETQSILSVYREAKRSIEESFYSNRIPVNNVLDSFSDRTGNSSSFATNISRIDTRESSYVGTISLDDASRGATERDDGLSATDDIEAGNAVEISNDGKVFVDGKDVVIDKSDAWIEKDAERLNGKPWRNLSVRKWMFGGPPPKEESNIDFSPDISQIVDEDEHNNNNNNNNDGQPPPPIQTVYADNLFDQPTLDD